MVSCPSSPTYLVPLCWLYFFHKPSEHRHVLRTTIQLWCSYHHNPHIFCLDRILLCKDSYKICFYHFSLLSPVLCPMPIFTCFFRCFYISRKSNSLRFFYISFPSSLLGIWQQHHHHFPVSHVQYLSVNSDGHFFLFFETYVGLCPSAMNAFLWISVLYGLHFLL